MLTVTHNLNVSAIVIQVYDNSSNLIDPSQTTIVNNNSATVDLTGFTVSGTWTVVVIGGAGSGPQNIPNSQPADASISASQLVLWFDDTPGSAKLMIKAKNSSGTVVTGNVSLT